MKGKMWSDGSHAARCPFGWNEWISPLSLSITVEASSVHSGWLYKLGDYQSYPLCPHSIHALWKSTHLSVTW